MTKKTVWILTSEYNDYDQYGEYFEKAYLEKPSIEQLMDFFKNKALTERVFWKKSVDKIPTYLLEQIIEEAKHVHAGGGRIHYEDCWYNLTEEEVG